MSEAKKNFPLIVVGWREWIALPDLRISLIKTKIDTGARTSALHAFDIEPYKKNNKLRVRFKVHPRQRDNKTVASCEAEVWDQRWVRDSSGRRELRYVIITTLKVNGASWPIEISLTNRDEMGFRMLLGRTAINHHFIVDPSHSFLTKRRPK